MEEDKTRQCIKKQRHHFANKGPYSQSYGFSSSHVWMWELDHKGGWTLKNGYFRTLVLKKTLESPLDCKENEPVNPKGNQSWIFIGRTEAEAEAPILWPPDAKNHLIGKDPDAGKDWGQEEKGWQRMRWLSGITDSIDKSEQALGDSEGQGSLACRSPWGHKGSDMTDWKTTTMEEELLVFSGSWPALAITGMDFKTLFEEILVASK